MLPDTPIHPCWPLMPPDPLPATWWPLMLLTPNPLLFSWAPTPSNAPWNPLQPCWLPNTPYTSCWLPDGLLMPPHPCQWECWDPGLGPNVVRLPVYLPPSNAPNTAYQPLTLLLTPWCPLTPGSGNTGTPNWGPMWLGSQSTCHPHCPYAPC